MTKNEMIFFAVFSLIYLVWLIRFIRKVEVAKKIMSTYNKLTEDRSKGVWVMFIVIKEDGTDFPAFAISDSDDHKKAMISVFSSRIYSYEMAVDEFLLTKNAKK